MSKSLRIVISRKRNWVSLTQKWKLNSKENNYNKKQTTICHQSEIKLFSQLACYIINSNEWILLITKFTQMNDKTRKRMAHFECQVSYELSVRKNETKPSITSNYNVQWEIFNIKF